MQIYILCFLLYFITSCLASHGLLRRVHTPPRSPEAHKATTRQRSESPQPGNSSMIQSTGNSAHQGRQKSPSPNSKHSNSSKASSSRSQSPQTRPEPTRDRKYRTMIGGPPRGVSPVAATAEVFSSGRHSLLALSGVQFKNGEEQYLVGNHDDPANHPPILRHLRSTSVAIYQGRVRQNDGEAEINVQGSELVKCHMRPDPTGCASYTTFENGIPVTKNGNPGEPLDKTVEAVPGQGMVGLRAKLEGPGQYYAQGKGLRKPGRTPSPERE